MHLNTSLLIIALTMSVDIPPHTLFDFSASADISNWRIIDDGVMGGRSQGNFHINNDGHGHFTGNVSLENNGGFSSLRFSFKEMKVNDFSKICIVLKGDQRNYQVRLKSSRYDRHSYTKSISTSGEWQTIEILMSEMIPTFRGRQLNMPNYPGEQLAEFAILIGNKRAEQFNIELDTIFFLQ